MAPANRANKKASNSLVALSSAAVLTVYAAGYVRTRSAADRFALQAAARRPAEVHPAQEAPSVPGASQLSQGLVQVESANAERAPVAPRATASSSFPAEAATQGHVPVPESEPVPADPPATPPAPTPMAVEIEQKNADAALSPAAPPRGEYKDGTYLGWGHCRHGDIQASVVIAGGRIASATIAQ